MLAERFRDDALAELRKYKRLAERAVAQLPAEHFFTAPDPEGNSVALIMKHMAGNMRSRWTDLLTTDGEKPDRHRDLEFEQEAADTRDEIRRQWEQGWACTFAAIESLRAADFARTVTIRGEPHSVLQAINRQLTHYAYHVGQIVLLARYFAGDRWQSLSIPKGRSGDYEVARSGTPYPLGPGSSGDGEAEPPAPPSPPASAG